MTKIKRKKTTKWVSGDQALSLDLKAFRALRVERGLSIRAAALAMGIDFQKLWTWEVGQCPPRDKGLAVLRKFYGQDLEKALKVMV
jgi:DNA-binding transcriptional regulator YiaG